VADLESNPTGVGSMSDTASLPFTSFAGIHFNQDLFFFALTAASDTHQPWWTDCGMATNGGTGGGAGGGTENSLKDLISSSKKDKFLTLTLSHEIISGISRQITGIDNELSTVVRMQQFKSYNVASLLSIYISLLLLLLLFLPPLSLQRTRRVMRLHKELWLSCMKMSMK
jgi:hypothetical protein